MPDRIAVLETTKGTIRFRLYESLAPITTKNFIELAEKGFYNGLTFHRYVPGFVIQGGCPLGTGTGDAGHTIPLEVTPELKHNKVGMVAMARAQDPNSASCQFYITLAPASHLDMKYAIFGEVIEGLENVMALRQGDRMLKVTIESPSEE
ncbi:peptidyl-prolyl cis-trans isomerase (rotamase)-cyclophilin family [Chthonomonas calidirosea]|uniref:Peptidyl-prolyl cis-trans isomerase n=1 Tax=Chthonomonas calidirosea (strain DSM 23976 / ICMP 18418 / T49) TaxID=1303518 RepID=S0EVE6_CHTCT|nr:peptidylprolyl isomerase [Chthonomonas calidirosea]CCW35743.1 Peptidyl-prolyl cis-trans isomerase (rotamase)-cyclophilin family [Chthonomonas calidirosea T49]CEK19370.1 peptidyl-prolyl cis-trans isomerase (rotamase)-cyclophilin family [Chthonomonas calidirosea]